MNGLVCSIGEIWCSWRLNNSLEFFRLVVINSFCFPIIFVLFGRSWSEEGTYPSLNKIRGLEPFQPVRAYINLVSERAVSAVEGYPNFINSLLLCLRSFFSYFLCVAFAYEVVKLFQAWRE